MSGMQTSKKPTNLSLDVSLLAEAKELNINLSSAAEDGLRQAVAQAKSERWKVENAEALESSNKWVEKNGLPLERYRQF